MFHGQLFCLLDSVKMHTVVLQKGLARFTFSLKKANGSKKKMGHCSGRRGTLAGAASFHCLKGSMNTSVYEYRAHTSTEHGLFSSPNSLGVKALILVGLERVANFEDLMTLEFGRGFTYNQPLRVNLLDLDFELAEQLVRNLSSE